MLLHAFFILVLASFSTCFQWPHLTLRFQSSALSDQRTLEEIVKDVAIQLEKNAIQLKEYISGAEIRSAKIDKKSEELTQQLLKVDKQLLKVDKQLAELIG